MYRLKRATVWLLRYFSYLKKTEGPLSKEAGKSLCAEISVQELKMAEELLVRYEQGRIFFALRQCLAEGKKLTSRVCDWSIRKLTPFISDGLLRVGGRLSKAPISHVAKHPIILPNESHITQLIVRWYHESVGHAGIGHSFTAIKKRYWILKGSSAIRKVLNDCMTCRRRSAPFCEQLMADLPKCRLQMNQAPFFHTGVDCFGVFLVKQGRSLVKRYGCIFTCMTVRAVHLEAVHSLSTGSFISAIRRFIGRGNVGHMYSDNGTNFVGSERSLRTSIQNWNQHQIGDFLKQKEIDWHFNTPTASNFGGSWERLIRSVRRVLTSLTSETKFSEEGLVTLLIEVESILNGRPSTPVSFVEDLQHPLTPKDLLLLCPGTRLPPTSTDNADAIYANRWRQAQLFADRFWHRWAKEY